MCPVTDYRISGYGYCTYGGHDEAGEIDDFYSLHKQLNSFDIDTLVSEKEVEAPIVSAMVSVWSKALTSGGLRD